MSSAVYEPKVAGMAKRDFPWAWECWAAAACVFGYGLADPRIYQPHPLLLGDYILAVGKVRNALIEPAVVSVSPQMLVRSQHFLYAQLGCLAVGIGMGIS